MALKIVLLALLVYCASEAQSQGDDTSLPLTYNVTELQGDGATCPIDELRQETRENITNNVGTLLQDIVIPLLDLPTPEPTSPPECDCMSGGRRIAYLDMTDPNQQCPPEMSLYTTPRRSCGRNTIGDVASCVSAFYPNVPGESYSRVCGRILAYQYCTPDAFNKYNRDTGITIDDHYVDGVSVTHGSNPREHVWTFAAAYAEGYLEPSDLTCPCTNINNNDNPNILIPPFVGDDYFCDTGTFDAPGSCSLSNTFYTEDPLWDGAGCSSVSTCCTLNNPPWFCKSLPQPTTNDIEVRICANRGSALEDTPIELIELYVN